MSGKKTYPTTDDITRAFEEVSRTYVDPTPTGVALTPSVKDVAEVLLSPGIVDRYGGYGSRYYDIDAVPTDDTVYKGVGKFEKETFIPCEFDRVAAFSEVEVLLVFGLEKVYLPRSLMHEGLVDRELALWIESGESGIFHWPIWLLRETNLFRGIK